MLASDLQPEFQKRLNMDLSRVRLNGTFDDVQKVVSHAIAGLTTFLKLWMIQ